ncbi:4-oxalocrotonate tautomerase [Burkholderia aenigmatica]|uniref:Tautomerase n=1 Tax=Burkholderia aenigmatica TaxID=2015348 RepID=A0A6J5J615_9BURK|nr:4-oxalocrotonate tautomerase [Burkholderia aenigmatica]VWC36958.1 4-oxalocrotonate tautomerase [Burkholderia aenigmatica]
MTKQEAIVPVAHLYILEGRDDDKKERLIAEVTQAIHRSLDAPVESVRVIITEMPKAHFGIGGQSAKQRGR